MRGRAIPDKFRAFLDLNHNLPSLEITSLTHSLSLFGIKENERKQLLIRFFFFERPRNNKNRSSQNVQ